MRTIKKASFILFVAVTLLASQAGATSVTAPATSLPPQVRLPIPTTTYPTPTATPIAYRHGDCSWIPRVAQSAGWSNREIPRLIEIIKRESGCCPRRIGGDRVDANCTLIKVVDWSHRSDTGLLQINGVHWKQDHKQYQGLICKRMGICEQEPLLDPLINLGAGRLLFDVAGWSPWQVNPKR
jgi:hypothetical protein